LSDDDPRSLVIDALHKTTSVFNDPSVSERLRSPDSDVTLEEMGLDSLDLVEWSLALEGRTGLEIDPAELTGATQLSDVVRIVAAKLNARGQ
jgi:acyl carrier protein